MPLDEGSFTIIQIPYLLSHQQGRSWRMVPRTIPGPLAIYSVLEVGLVLPFKCCIHMLNSVPQDLAAPR